MAKGTESKNTIFKTLQKCFPDAFWEDEGKILRVPLSEDGTRVEIKVTLTAAKANLGGDMPPSAFIPSSVNASVMNEPIKSISSEDKDNKVLEPTDEEKENVAKIIAALGL